MALKDILQLVHNELVANGTLSDPVLYLGASAKAQRLAPPAIFWVPKRGTGMGGPVMAMPRAIQIAWAAANPTKQIPRALHTRAVNVEAHLWAGEHAAGDDFSATEALLDATISALHHQAYGCYTYHGEEWIPTGTDTMALGRRLVLFLDIMVPVLETTPTPSAVKITNVTVTGQMGPIYPGGSTVTNP